MNGALLHQLNEFINLSLSLHFTKSYCMSVHTVELFFFRALWISICLLVSLLPSLSITKTHITIYRFLDQSKHLRSQSREDYEPGMDNSLAFLFFFFSFFTHSTTRGRNLYSLLTFANKIHSICLFEHKTVVGSYWFCGVLWWQASFSKSHKYYCLHMPWKQQQQHGSVKCWPEFMITGPCTA